jgi:DNA invertase Pin-like site-specific DNA recombinase
MKAVAYYRVSTDEQAESGAGLAAQHDACRAYCGRLGIPMAEADADDGVSGAAPVDRRPGLLDALGLLEKGDVLLVSKRDRLARERRVIVMIEAAVERIGCRVVSAAGEGTQDDDPASILMRIILDGVAEYERLIIKARTKAALRAKQRRGQRTGKVPLGFDLADDGQRSKEGRPIALVANAGEQETIATIRALRSGGRTFRAIAAELDRLGIPTKEGRAAWHHSSVARILNRTA